MGDIFVRQAVQILRSLLPQVLDDGPCAALLQQEASWLQGLRVFVLLTSCPRLAQHALAAAIAFRPLLVPYVHEVIQQSAALWSTSPIEALHLLGSLADLAYVFPSLRPLAASFVAGSPPLEILLHQAGQCGVPEGRVVTSVLILLLSVPNVRTAWGDGALLQLMTRADAYSRWVGVRCACVVLALADHHANDLEAQVMSSDEAVRCAMVWRAHCVRLQEEAAKLWSEELQHVMLGAGGVREGQADVVPSASYESQVTARAQIPAPTGYVNILGVMLPCNTAAPSVRSAFPRGAFVRTAATLAALHAAAMAVEAARPLLLIGAPGCGKSSVAAKLASETGNTDMLELYMDDQVDAKALLGAYICSSTPGEYHWQPGPLAQAVKKGWWVLLDNMQLAPVEVFVFLNSLLSRRVLHVPQRGEIITAHPNFRIIATLQTGASAVVEHSLATWVSAWTPVRLPHAQLSDQVEVLSGRFPGVQLLILPLMAIMHLVKESSASDRFDGRPSGDSSEPAAWSLWREDVSLCMAAADLKPGELMLSLSRPQGLHDAVKCCERLVQLHSGVMERAFRQLPGLAAACMEPASLLLVSADARQALLVEAADTLVGHAVGEVAKGKVLTAISNLLALPQDIVGHVLTTGKPSLSVTGGVLAVGRVSLLQDADVARSLRLSAVGKSRGSSTFAETGHAMRLMESIAAATKLGEPLLLVGESGTGKTSLIQFVAQQIGQKLVAINLSNQSDSSDLLGGFKPMEVGMSLLPLVATFDSLVRATWVKGNNVDFLARVHAFASNRKWPQLLRAFDTALAKVKAASQSGADDEEPAASRKAKRICTSRTVQSDWAAFADAAAAAKRAVDVAEGGFAFHFVEGALVEALRNGHWLLLDEINLAPPQVLERIMGLLESSDGSLVLLEKGDVKAVPRHPSFRLFAAMNPATDAGKRHLPAQIRSHFTELYVSEPDQENDIASIVNTHLATIGPAAPVQGIVTFFLEARKLAATALADGVGQKPIYNLRSLSRALQYASAAAPAFGLPRALYDGFVMCFMTMLSPDSAARVEALLRQHVLAGQRLPAAPSSADVPPALQRRGESFVHVEGFWLERGPEAVPDEGGPDVSGFVVTPAVATHLRNIARAVTLRKYPVLLQGPTSSGKTSLVEHLARVTGHKFVRINNHEHTDLQEYMGCYVSDDRGRLQFKEGALVRAVRLGHWVVLDELNLAPTEVLEALNRLLDDNRQLFVAELQEMVDPHPHFMLFGTQNPPGTYAGRKVLSRAFRSRFLELHVDDIPPPELVTILERRCAIAPSHAQRLVAAMLELQRRRTRSNVFAGKHGFITARDLFRWANRGAISYEELALNGYLLLAERLRSDEERGTVARVLGTVFKAELDVAETYSREGAAPLDALRLAISDSAGTSDADSLAAARSLSCVVWTKALQRMYTLTSRCLEHSEPVLLVGETGTGKTTLCQMLAFMRRQRLHIINANMHTESADIIGGYRPTRHRQAAITTFCDAFEAVRAHPVWATLAAALPDLPSSFDVVAINRAVADLHAALEQLPAANPARAAVAADVARAAAAGAQACIPFQWEDGPLVTAMRRGDVVLIDEINLAEDAVLERLNSVLEPARTLTLAEKGGDGAEVVVAAPGFRVVATMNPGGDHGKRELSPALSNRFTQVWVPAVTDMADVAAIVRGFFPDAAVADAVTPLLLDFWAFFAALSSGAKHALSLRDVRAWCEFVTGQSAALGAEAAYLHGAFLVVVDGLGLGTGAHAASTAHLQAQCVAFLRTQVPRELEPVLLQAAGVHPCPPAAGSSSAAPAALAVNDAAAGDATMDADDVASSWGMQPFFVPVGPDFSPAWSSSFHFGTPTTAKNAFRVLRAMQLRKPILLEGSPGVGKTSLVAAMAAAAGHRLVRINLSDQTDIMDLLGADLPASGGAAGHFQWCDGPLLQAIKSGSWVLLDELNLANQGVLEGLNAVLDHRQEVFIPELSVTVRCPPSFRLFAAQNPIQEGGGRKGLPQSFINRFSRVLVELLEEQDLLHIAAELHPHIPRQCLSHMVAFVSALHRRVNVGRHFGQSGAPWEFNLRDLLRWCQLIAADVQTAQSDALLAAAEADAPHRVAASGAHYAAMLFAHRMRTPEDRRAVARLFAEAWPGNEIGVEPKVDVVITPHSLRVGRAVLTREGPPPDWMPPAGAIAVQPFSTAADATAVAALRQHLAAVSTPAWEWLASCVNMAWMALLVSPDVTAAADAVRLMASAMSTPLVEIPLAPASDTSDLLGGFEQLDPARALQGCASQLHSAARVLCAALLRPSGDQPPSFEARVQLCDAVSGVLSELDALVGGGAAGGAAAPDGGQAPALEQMSSALQAAHARLAGFCARLDDAVLRAAVERRLASCGAALGDAVSVVSAMEGASIGGRFQWVDGLLLSAIEHGHWVLMLQPNLCSAAVLDRLNSLLEPSGFLYVNECGTTAGGPRVIQPHPAFRLFLVMDPADGEVSRAMRNRGIEIFFDSTPTPDPAAKALVVPPLTSPERALSGWGVPTWHLPEWMAQTHAVLAASSEGAGVRARLQSAALLRLWATNTTSLLRLGYPLPAALAAACEFAYSQRPNCSAAAVSTCQLALHRQRALALEAAPQAAHDAAARVDALLVAPSARAASAHPLSGLVAPLVCDAVTSAAVASALALLQPLLVQAAQLQAAAAAVASSAASSSPPAGDAADLPLVAVRRACFRACALELSATVAATLASVPVECESVTLAVANVLQPELESGVHAGSPAEVLAGQLRREAIDSFIAALADDRVRGLRDAFAQAADVPPNDTAAVIDQADDEAGALDGSPAALASWAQAARAIASARIHAAWLKGVEESAAEAFARDELTPMQASALLCSARGPQLPRPQHAFVPVLHHLVAAVAGVEGCLLDRAASPGLPSGPSALAALRVLQELREHLCSLVHPRLAAWESAAPGGADALAANLPLVTYLVHAALRHCDRRCLPLLRPHVATQQRVAAFRDAADLATDTLGLRQQSRLSLALWRAGGRPLLPRTLQGADSCARMQRLCGAAFVPAGGFQVSVRDAPAALEAAGVAWTLPDSDGEAAAAAARAAAETCAAAVACSAPLRASLLQAASLLLVAASRGSEHGSSADDRQAADALDDLPRLALDEVTAAVAVAVPAAVGVGGDNASGRPPPPAVAAPLQYLCVPALPAPLLSSPVGRDAQVALVGLERVRLAGIGWLHVLCRGTALALLAVLLSADAAPARAQHRLTGDELSELRAQFGDAADRVPALQRHLADAIATFPALASASPSAAAPHQIMAWAVADGAVARMSDPLHMAWAEWHRAATAADAALPPAALVSALAPLLPHKLAATLTSSPPGARSTALSSVGRAGAAHVASEALRLVSLAGRAKLPLRDLPAHRSTLQTAVAYVVASLASQTAAPPAPIVSEVALLAALAAQVVAAFAGHCQPDAAAVAACALAMADVSAELADALESRPGAPVSQRLLLRVQLLQAGAAHVAQRLAALPLPPLQALAATCLDGVCDAVAQTVAGLQLAGWAPSPALRTRVGSAWSLLGLLKVHLLAPPPGLDPADVSRQQRAHLERTLEHVVAPELRVRRALHTYPLLPNQRPEASALVAREGGLRAAAAELCDRDALRPEPPQYAALVAETQRLVTGALALDTVERLVASLAAAPDTDGAGQRLALSEAAALDSFAAAWVGSTEQRFPLYGDLLSPFTAALADLRRGLQILHAQARLNAASPSAHELSRAVAACVTFPLPLLKNLGGFGGVQPPSIACYTSAQHQETVCARVAASLLEAAREVASASAPTTLQTLATTVPLQLHLRALLAACHACVPLAELCALQQTVATAQAVLTRVVDLWRRGRDLRAELALREDALFKTNAQRERVFTLTEDAEDDVAFRAEHRDMTTAFADLLDGPLGDDDAPRPDVFADVDDDEASMSAVVQQLAATLEDPTVQRAIVGVHARLASKLRHDLGPAGAPSSAAPSPDAHATDHVACLADSGFELGAALLQSQGGFVESWVDGAAASGVLRRLLRQLHETGAQARGGGDGVDVASPCIAEAQLAVAPVQRLAARLETLLDRFPEQPMLLQIQAVCVRLLGLPVDAPLKEAMVGVELLIGRLKTWQDHNASEREGTSLADLEGDISGLAARWRRLELAGWRSLIDRSLARQRDQALVHWFHLFDILFVRRLPLPQALPALEEFLQICTLAQFAVRLELLATLSRWCALLLATDAPSDGRERLQLLAVCLENVRAYYGQHGVAVEQELEAGLAPVRKELRDYVKLERWEHKGYHDLKITTERAQRKLHKCNRQAIAAASQPVAPLFARLAAKVGIVVVRGLAAGLVFDAIQAPSAMPDGDAAAMDEDGSGDVPVVEPAAPAPASSSAAVDSAAQTEALLASVPSQVVGSLQQLCSALAASPGSASGAAQWSDAPPELQTSLADAQLWRNRNVASLARRLCDIVSSRKAPRAALVDTCEAAARAGESVLMEANSAGCQVLALWAADGTKGARARRKKALVDFIKTLSALGVSSSRSAVPPAERDPAAWFQVPQAADTAGPLADSDALDTSPFAPQAAALWQASCTRYQQAVASTRELWTREKELHADVSRREAQMMKHQAEHLLFLLRSQSAALLRASVTAAHLSQLRAALADVLPGLRAASGAEKRALPPQAVCRAALPALLDGLANATHLLRGSLELLPAVLEHPATRSLLPTSRTRLTGALSRLDAAHAALRDALRAAAPEDVASGVARLGAASPLVFTPSLLDAMLAAFDAASDAAAGVSTDEAVTDGQVRLPHVHRPLTLSDLLPGWRPAATALAALAADGAAFRADVDAAMVEAERPNPVGHIKATAEHLEAALSGILKWAQSLASPPAPAAGDADGGEPAVDAGELAARMSRQLAASASLGIVPSLARCLSCAVAAGAPALPRALLDQLKAVAGMVRVAEAALCGLMVHAVLLHAALSHFALMSVAIFVAYMRDGFGRGEGDESEGQGAGEGGTGVFKEEEGTGLGEGDTSHAKDVSEQIENEDQIMGAQTQEQRDQEREEREPNPGQEDDDVEGVDMQQDFDGDLEDVPDDERRDDKDGDDDAEEPELEKQVGDAGESADVVDEKMWEGEDPEDEGAEERKDAGYNDKATGERGDAAERKMVAGERGEDEDDGGGGEPQPPEGEPREETAEEEGGGGEEGELDPSEVAAQMAQDDHVQPQEQPPELELGDDLNLDNADMDEGDGGGDGDDEAGGEQAPVDEGGRGTDDAPPAGDDGDDGARDALPEDVDMDAPEGDDAAAGGAPDEGMALEEDAADEEGVPEGEEGADPVPAPVQEEGALDDTPAGPSGPQGATAAAASDASRQQGPSNAESQAPQTAVPSAGGQGAAEQADAQADQSSGAAAGAQGGDSAPRQPLDQSARDAQAAAGADEPQQPRAERSAADEANPFRNLGDALERWRARLNVVQDAAEDGGAAGGDEDAPAEAQEAAEYEFAPSQAEGSQALQTLAAGTQHQAEEQVAQLAGAETAADGDGAGRDEDMQLDDQEAPEPAADAASQPQAAGAAGGAMQAAAQDAASHDLSAGGADGEAMNAELAEGELPEQQRSVAVAEPDAGAPVQGVDGLLAEMDALLRIDDSRTAGDEADAARGHSLWQRCQTLVAGLTGELVEQLRLVLEPTRASRLSGDYKTGKRINMKKVIAYIASSFRKDKIWLRRTKPDKRTYQVVVAIDETRSMQDNRCALFALEALALITSAMVRLEVGTLGVVGFGGSGGPRLLHALDTPWTDASAQTVMGKLRFDEDNTLRDAPVLDMMRQVSELLQRERHTALASTARLSQLLLIVADGRFHEKDALWRVVRDASQERSLLIAFIILDAHGDSVLDLQSVSFENGVPVFKKYLDSFPFPFYLVLQDIQHLPRLLADLLRQWLVLSSA